MSLKRNPSNGSSPDSSSSIALMTTSSPRAGRTISNNKTSTAAKKFTHVSPGTILITEYVSIAHILQEYWNELQYQVSRGDIDAVQGLLLKNPVGYDANIIAESTAVPKVSPLHIACRIGGTEMVKLLLPHCDINVADQVHKSFGLHCWAIVNIEH